jgi:predicted metal-dependent phosphoesterase TrpH
MSADLHVHTSCSDGVHSPEAIIELAKKAKLKTLSVTDHDAVTGIVPAQRKGKELGVEVIPGIEFTTDSHDTEIHILGYFIDYHSPELLDTIKKIQRGREDRIYGICEKLKGIGVELEAERVFELAGHRDAGRPHVANALLAAGYVKSFKEAFNKYIAFGGPAYVPHYKLSPVEAVALVVKAKGIPVFAHPGTSSCDQVIPELMAAGLAGLEVYHRCHKPKQVEHYLELTKKYDLLVTGGTDFHGFENTLEAALGSITIPDELVEKLKNEHLRRNKS